MSKKQVKLKKDLARKEGERKTLQALKLRGSKRKALFKQILTYSVAYRYRFNPGFQSEKSLRLFGHPHIELPCPYDY
ncbi:MAG: hypothetical protein PHY16_14280 [Methylobacter sp.]|nr:hypothetical protein [Methylobacter sp.]